MPPVKETLRIAKGKSPRTVANVWALESDEDHQCLPLRSCRSLGKCSHFSRLGFSQVKWESECWENGKRSVM